VRALGLPSWAVYPLLAVGYFLFARVGYLLLDPATRIAAWWPPSGLYLAALLLLPRRRWPLAAAAILPAAVVGSLLSGRNVGLAFWFFVGNTLEAAAGAWLVARAAGPRPSPSTLRGAFALATLPALSAGAILLVLRGAQALVLGGPFPRATWMFWGGSSLGAVLVAPLLVAWLEPTPGGARRRGFTAEAFALGASLLLAVGLVANRADAPWAHEVVLVPPLLWAAIRFGPRGATLGLAAIALAMVLLLPGNGAAGAPPRVPASLPALQFFLAALVVTVLLVAAASEESARAARALLRSEERLRLVEAAIDQASDAVNVLEADGRIVWLNDAHARALGQPKERLLGRSLLEVVRGLDPAEFRRRWDEVVRRRVLVSPYPFRTPDGRRVPGEVASAALDFGGRAYVVSSVRDVSDRRHAEAAARLAGIGTLAAGVAHEINNPLAYVLTNLAWLREQLDTPGAPPDALRQAAEEAHGGAERVRDIVHQLRLFARPDERVGPIDVAAAARSALTLARNEIRHRAALVTRLGDVPPVLGNENRLAQVFLNLLTNAAQAIPDGHADRNEIRLEVRAGEEGTVVAEVSDSGAGIPEEIRAHLFEPFLTTKAVGRGMGLGLFVCHGIVAGMGGRIEVEPRAGAGTIFRLVLPAAEAEARGEPAVPRPAPPARRGRVLVLDDDERVAGALRRILEREHRVDVLTDARDALARVRAGEAWDVVFCDLMMPDMSGAEWFEEVRRADPALASRVVFVTGGAFTDAAREFLGRVPNARLEKPFAPDEVRAAVAERLAGDGRARDAP
jgi:PAS domain S-box-containing protein